MVKVMAGNFGIAFILIGLNFLVVKMAGWGLFGLWFMVYGLWGIYAAFKKSFSYWLFIVFKWSSGKCFQMAACF